MAFAAGIALAACRPPDEDLGKERILRARISIDHRWSLCPPNQTAPASGYCRTPEEVELAVGNRHLRGGAGAERLRVLFLYRDSERLDRVISHLEAEVRKAPGEANPLVDLAAAQLTAGWAQGLTGRFVDALESADRALEVAPGNSRACFNRAFALEELGLRELARKDWESCERLEPDPEWRDEARQRAEALSARPTSTQDELATVLDKAIRNGKPNELAHWAQERPHQTASLVIRDLLPRWVETGPIAGAAWWPSLEHLAERVRQSTGDRLLADVVREIQTAFAEQRGEEVTEGIRRLRQGLALYRQREYQDAVVRLREGERSLRKVPALGMVARIYGAVSLHSSNRMNEAGQELSRILAEAGGRGYSWPLGYAHWTLGRIASSEGHLLTALDHHRQAIQAFERIRAEDLVLSVRVMMAEAYSTLGQPEPAWDSARKALLKAHRLGASDRLFFVLNLLAGIADEQGRSGLALYAQTSAINHAAGEPPRLRANAHLWRAYYLGREQLHDRAQDDLRKAEELAREVVDSSEGTRLEAEISLARGVLALQTDPEAAVAWLGDAARLFEQTGGRFNRLVALKTRAEALRRKGRIKEAVEDLEKAMAAYDVAVRDLAEGKDGRLSEPDRLSYLLQNADVYQEMVDLHVRELASPWKALVLAEHAKLLRSPGQPLDLHLLEGTVDRWIQALPPETALVSYSTAEERIVAWVLTPSVRRFVPLGSAEDVAALTDRLGRARDAEGWEDLSQKIYGRLVGPLEESLLGVHRILIVPTPGLDRVPFAGLLDPRSGRYLAESYLLEMLPSAAALLSKDGSSRGRIEQRPGLVIGDPKPTKAALLGLAPLKFAEQEARGVAASLGPDTVLLLGSDATPGRFRKEAVGAGIIHVAGHALALGRSPDTAALVLATGAGDEEGLLTAREILRLPLSGTDLVILSACSSAGGPAISWQSGLTLGRSFLSAGAERVVATLHAVDDEESAKLFKAFHRELAAGNDAAASLRNAQREVLKWRLNAERWTLPSWPYMIILGSRPSK